jgi:hypothetical protein
MLNMSLELVQLRLAAALTHQLSTVALTVWSSDGPSFVVSRDRRHHPDLSACALRDMVRGAMTGTGSRSVPEWLHDVADLTVDGLGVRHVGDGVVAVEHGELSGRWWPTLLDADQLATVLGGTGEGMPGSAEVAAHVDRELAVTVVRLRLPSGSAAHDRRCDEAARALSRACVISELLEGAGSGSRT